MQIAPILLGGVALFALSRKKKRKVSSEPKIERFGRVVRYANAAAVRQIPQSVDLTPPPMVVYMYAKSAALDKVTQAMMAQAETFQNVEFIQLPLSAAASVARVDSGLPADAAGMIAGVHERAIFVEFIHPKDDPATIAGKVTRRAFFAITGKEKLLWT